MRQLALLLFLFIALLGGCIVRCFGDEGGSMFGTLNHRHREVGEQIQLLPPSCNFDDYDFSQSFLRVLQNNKAYSHKCLARDSQYFIRHAKGQSPKFMWIGCSDSRVIPEQILGLQIGEVFVHRNVANQVNPVDQNVMSALEYAVEYLNIETVIVAGHYECGGIKASLTNRDFGHLESWLSQIRQIRYKNIRMLSELPEKERFNKLIEINVVQQAKHLTRNPLIQQKWKEGKKMEIVGVVYDIRTGLLKNVMKPINGFEDIPEAEEFVVFTYENH